MSFHAFLCNGDVSVCTMTRIYPFYRPQRSCGQGYVFTRVCDSVHRGVCLSACWDNTHPLPPRTRPPGKQAPPGKQTYLEAGTPRKPTPREAGTPSRKQAPLAPGKQAPPGIRSMSGRYASYWNAFLFLVMLYLQVSR